MKDIIDVIKENSLTVRCLPFVAISYWTYREGDEEKINNPTYDSNGKIRDVKRTIVTDATGRKMIREERIVENSGWWYVIETPHTDSTINFNREDDTFFAPTIDLAIELYLKSKKEKVRNISPTPLVSANTK
jgi:hypothetical protein